MPNLPDGLSTASEHTHQSPSSPRRPLGVTLIALYFMLATLVELVLVLAPSLSPAGYPLPGGANSIYLPQVSIPLGLFVTWGLWQCHAWARAVIICVGMPVIVLSFLSGTAGFKTWMVLAIVLYLFQRRIGEVFSPTTDPRP